MIALGEPRNAMRITWIGPIVLGIVGLKLFGGGEAEREDSDAEARIRLRGLASLLGLADMALSGGNASPQLLRFRCGAALPPASRPIRANCR